MEPKMVISKNNIKELRIKALLTQKELAKRLQLKSGATVCMWESGERVPGTELLPRLARIFNCTIDELFEHSDSEKGE